MFICNHGDDYFLVPVDPEVWGGGVEVTVGEGPLWIRPIFTSCDVSCSR